MNPTFYVDGSEDKDLRRFKEWFYQANYTQNSSSQQQAYLDMRFKAGDQKVTGFYPGGVNYLDQRNLYFNQIQKHINLLTGHQLNNRKSTVALASHASHDSLANDSSELTSYSEKIEQYQDFHSDAFDACVTQGQCLLEMFPDYSDDPFSPDFKLNLVSRVNYIVDNNFRRRDMTDCQGVWRRSWVTKAMAKQLVRGRDKEIDKLRPVGYKDQKFPLQAELQSIDLSNLHCYDEFFYQDYREATMIEDPKSSQSYEYFQHSWEDPGTLDFILFKQPWLKVKKVKKPTVKLCISIDNKEFYQGPNLLNIDPYPFALYSCYWEKDLTYSYRERGIVRDLRDPQWLLNRIRILQLQMLESQPNSGWIYPVDVVTDERAFRQTLNGVLIPLKKGHSVDEIKKIETAQIDPSVFQLSELLFQDFEKISGINSELFGIGEDDAAGILAMMRRASGVVTLQSILNNLDIAQTMMGRIRLEAMQKNWTPEKMQMILGRPVDERFFFNSVTKYNLQVEEGPYSPMQRQTEFKQVLYLKELGMQFSDEFILQKSLVFNKDEAMADLQATKQQQAQQMQAQAQVETQKNQADNIVKMAQAKMDLAKARDLNMSSEERKAKVVDLFASAEHKNTQSDLDIVEKMLKLEDASFTQLKNNIEFAQQLKNPKPQRVQ